MANFTCVGPVHPSWKGGKCVSSHGYIRIRLPRGHHLRDANGSGYEHRVVAEEKYGRRLQVGEKVHHLDGNKQNNAPENLVVCKSDKHHLFFHRKIGFNRRLPDEPNPIITCACGCGQKFRKFDKGDRARKYKSGCNSRGETNPGARITAKLARKIKRATGTPTEVARRFGVTVWIVANMRHERKGRRKTWEKV